MNVLTCWAREVWRVYIHIRARYEHMFNSTQPIQVCWLLPTPHPDVVAWLHKALNLSQAQVPECSKKWWTKQ